MVGDEGQLYLGWVDDAGLDDRVEGPWTDVFVLRPGLLLIHSPHSRSEVYHALKHLLADDRPLLVAPLAGAPKFKGMAPGALAWVRARC